MKKNPYNLVSFIFVALSFVCFTAPAKPMEVEYWIAATHPCSITDWWKTHSFDTKGDDTEGFYCKDCQWHDSIGLSRPTVNDSEYNNEVTANEPKGLRFKGWWTKKGGWSDDVTPRVSEVDTLIESKVTIAGATIKNAGIWWTYPIVVAKYVPIYDIATVVDPVGAGSVTGAGTYEEGERISLASSAKDGYALKGWEKSGQSVSPTNFSLVAAQGCAGTYTAVFTGKVYRVDLRPKLGEGGTTVITATYGQPMPTPIVRPERYGYDFGGYFSLENGEGVQYYSADGTSLRSWDKAGPADLYACWIPQKGNLNLKFNPGVAKICYRLGESSVWVTNTPPDKTISLQVGTVVHAYALPSSGYEIDDYNIENQWETVKGKGVPKDGITFSPTAVKATPTYTVSFVDPTEAHETESQVLKEGAAATAPTWQRTGYELGWDRDFSSVAADMTVTAVWSPIKSVVRFDPNGGSGTMTDQTAVYDEALTLTSNKFVNGSLFFAHWTTSVDKVAYPDGAVVSNLTTVAGATNVFYAVWEKHSYVIRFNANGGAGQMADLNVDYGETRSLTQNAFTRSGWRFVRWQGPGETTFDDGESIFNLTTVDGEVIELFAVWSDSIDNLYSIAADCARTTSSEMAVELTTDNEAWCQILTGGGCTRGEDQYIRLFPQPASDPKEEASFSFVAPTNGVLTFFYRIERKNSNEKDNYLKVVAGTEELFKSADAKSDWGETPSPECKLCTGDVVTFRFYVSALGGQDGDYADIDGIRFVPVGDGSHPVPEATDAVTISSAAVADGKFSLSFKSDAKFDYNLLTNANLLIDSWGVMATEKGTGETVVVDPPVIDGMPQLFYKVETIQKQD